MRRAAAALLASWKATRAAAPSCTACGRSSSSSSQHVRAARRALGEWPPLSRPPVWTNSNAWRRSFSQKAPGSESPFKGALASLPDPAQAPGEQRRAPGPKGGRHAALKLQIQKATTPDEVLNLVVREVGRTQTQGDPDNIEFNLRGLHPGFVMAAMQRLNVLLPGRKLMQLKGEKRQELLNAAVEANADRFTIPALVNLLAIYTRLHLPPSPALLSAVQRAVRARSQPPSPDSVSDLTNILYSFSKMGLWDDELLEATKQVTWHTLRSASASELTAQRVSKLLWSYANLKYKPPTALGDALLHHAERLPHFKPQDSTMLLQACARGQHTVPKPLLRRLADCVAQDVSSYNGRALVLVVWAFSRLQHYDAVWLASLEPYIMRHVKQLRTQEVANLWYAYARLEHSVSPELADTIRQRIACSIDKFEPQGLAITMWAFVNLEAHPPGRALLDQMAHQGVRLAAEASPQNLANILWAYARLDGARTHSLLPTVAAASLRKLPDFAPQYCSNLVWAYGKLGLHPGEELMERMAAHAATQMKDFKGHELANLLWGYANLGYTPSPASGLLLALNQQTRLRMHTFQEQNLSNLLWSHARLATSPPRDLLDMLAGVVHNRLDEFTPQGLTNVVWAFATLGHYPGAELLDSVAMKAVRFLHTSTVPMQISNLMWAFSKLLHDPGDELCVVAESATVRLLPHLSPQELSNTLWGFAVLGRRPAGLLGALQEQLDNDMAVAAVDWDSFQSACTVVWALAIMRAHTLPWWRRTWDHVTRLDDPLTDEAKRQLFQAWLLVQSDCNSAVGKGGNLVDETISSSTGSAPRRPTGVSTVQAPPRWSPLLEQCRESWLDATSMTKMSKFHAAVSETLTRINVKHSIEVTTEDKLFSMDIGIHAVDNPDDGEGAPESPITGSTLSSEVASSGQEAPQSAIYKGLKVAIEVDGRTHFTCNTQRYLGTTLARARMLRARDWHIVSIPVFEWEVLQGPKEQEQYIQRKLAGLGVLPKESPMLASP